MTAGRAQGPGRRDPLVAREQNCGCRLAAVVTSPQLVNSTFVRPVRVKHTDQGDRWGSMSLVADPEVPPRVPVDGQG
jgi:hypothetical protein